MAAKGELTGQGMAEYVNDVLVEYTLRKNNEGLAECEKITGVPFLKKFGLLMGRHAKAHSDEFEEEEEFGGARGGRGRGTQKTSLNRPSFAGYTFLDSPSTRLGSTTTMILTNARQPSSTGSGLSSATCIDDSDRFEGLQDGKEITHKYADECTGWIQHFIRQLERTRK